MIYKRFTYLVILRIALLLANVIVIALIFGDKRLFFNQIILTILLTIQVGELIRFVSHTNRELAKFFYAIKHSDFSISFKHSVRGQSFEELQNSMSEIIQSYKQVKIEKEAQYHFLQMLVSQLHVGIIAIEKSDTITVMNETAENMLNVVGIRSWKLLTQKNPSFANEVEKFGENGKRLLEVKSANEKLFLLVEVRTVLILEKPLKLVTIQNIDSEIEQKEIEAWHKLIRILTHEIMNSVTPVSSLTETMLSMLSEKNGDQKQLTNLKEETISDIRFSLNTIQKRSEGLLTFIESYRRLTKVAKPAFDSINAEHFLNGAKHLLQQELARKQIACEILSENVTIKCDPVLIEQVIINLMTNSIHALDGRDNAKITLKCFSTPRQIIIEVNDNGKGIASKELNEIFIPFFSTKKDGSGIGLSLSKQIMSVHNGSLKVQSEQNKFTSFSLHFPRSH